MLGLAVVVQLLFIAAGKPWTGLGALLTTAGLAVSVASRAGWTWAVSVVLGVAGLAMLLGSILTGVD